MKGTNGDHKTIGWGETNFIFETNFTVCFCSFEIFCDDITQKVREIIEF